MAQPIKRRSTTEERRILSGNPSPPAPLPTGYRARQVFYITRHGDRSPGSFPLGKSDKREIKFWKDLLPSAEAKASWNAVFPFHHGLSYPSPTAVALTEKTGHAFRTPVAKGLDDYAMLRKSDEEQIAGKLTERGAAQLRAAGANLRKGYGNVTSDNVYLRCTYFPRTIRSGQNLLLGLFNVPVGDTGIVDDDTPKIMPVQCCAEAHGDSLTTQWETPKSKMFSPKMLSLFKSSIGQCMQVNGGQVENVKNTIETLGPFEEKVKNEVGDVKRLYNEIMDIANKEVADRAEGDCLLDEKKRLFKGESDFDSLSNWEALHRILALWDELHCRRHRDGRDGPSEIIDQAQSLIETSWAAGYHTIESQKLGVGRFMKEIAVRILDHPLDDNITGVMLSKEPRYRFVVYSGHDSSLFPMLSLFGINEALWPTFAAAITIEILEKTDVKACHDGEKIPLSDVFVRVLYEGKPYRLPTLEEFSGVKAGEDCVYPVISMIEFIQKMSYKNEIEYVMHSHSCNL